MQLDKFIASFKSFCDTKFGTKTGTATSYANALKYLFEYLGFTDIDEPAILTIKSIEPDIREKNCVFYSKILDDFASKGRTSYVEKGFVKAAIPALYEFLHEKQILLNKKQHIVLLDAIYDTKIIARFDQDKLKQVFPIAKHFEHTYDVSRVSGTTNEVIKKICNGRKAEKYFVSYLKDYLGLEAGIDFIDVSNNKEYGYDIRVFDCGIEVKNIKYGSFYLTDNEIARLTCSQTHLILADIDNGIWLLKNNAKWLHKIINDIKSIRQYCFKNYYNLDLSDIRINLDDKVVDDLIDVSRYGKEKFISVLIEQK